MGYTGRLQTYGRDDVAAVGGKAANLGELVRAGQPVPPGFVVTTESYQSFVDANGLAAVIAAAHPVGAADDAAYRQASATIREHFTGGTIDPKLRRAILGAYARLERGPVAVRSSATAEDLAEASFAGQQDTYLNIEGDDAAARRGPPLLGLAVDRAGNGLPRPPWDRPVLGPAGRGRATVGRRRRGRGDVHRQSVERTAEPDRDQRRLGAGRVGGQRVGEHRPDHRRHRGRPPAQQRGRRQDRRDGPDSHRNRGARGRAEPPPPSGPRRGGCARAGRDRDRDRRALRCAAGHRVGPPRRCVLRRPVPADHRAAAARGRSADRVAAAQGAHDLRPGQHHRAAARPADAVVRGPDRRLGDPLVAGTVRRAAPEESGPPRGRRAADHQRLRLLRL